MEFIYIVVIYFVFPFSGGVFDLFQPSVEVCGPLCFLHVGEVFETCIPLIGWNHE